MKKYAKEDKLNSIRGLLLLPYKDYSKLSVEQIDKLIVIYTKQLAAKK